MKAYVIWKVSSRNKLPLVPNFVRPHIIYYSIIKSPSCAMLLFSPWSKIISKPDKTRLAPALGWTKDHCKNEQSTQLILLLWDVLMGPKVDFVLQPSLNDKWWSIFLGILLSKKLFLPMRSKLTVLNQSAKRNNRTRKSLLIAL